MLKNILTSAIIVALIFGFSYSNVAQPNEIKIENTQGNEVTPQESSINSLRPVTIESTDKRVEAQVQRYVKDYNFTEQQKKDLIKILTDFENQSNELRNKLNSLNKEKTDKIEGLFTDEQKKMKEDIEKERRNRLLERRNDANRNENKKEIKSISIPEK